jgi:hypothetical protein
MDRLPARVSFAMLGKKIASPVYAQKRVQKSSVESGREFASIMEHMNALHRLTHAKILPK